MFGLSRRERALKKATGALAEFYQVLQPSPRAPLADLPMLAVDVETTGLSPRDDRLLSIGWVPIDGGTITLAGAGHMVLQQQDGTSVGESATIHGLTDDAVRAGTPAAEAVTGLLHALQGRVMVVHYATMEQGFLSAACAQHFGAELHVPIVDTFAVERRHMERMGTYPRGEDLRLARVRQRYGLPQYRNHNALTDALACAELYLALAAASRGTTLASMQP